MLFSEPFFIDLFSYCFSFQLYLLIIISSILFNWAIICLAFLVSKDRNLDYWFKTDRSNFLLLTFDGIYVPLTISLVASNTFWCVVLIIWALWEAVTKMALNVQKCIRENGCERKWGGSFRKLRESSDCDVVLTSSEERRKVM